MLLPYTEKKLWTSETILFIQWQYGAPHSHTQNWPAVAQIRFPAAAHPQKWILLPKHDPKHKKQTLWAIHTGMEQIHPQQFFSIHCFKSMLENWEDTFTGTATSSTSVTSWMHLACAAAVHTSQSMSQAFSAYPKVTVQLNPVTESCCRKSNAPLPQATQQQSITISVQWPRVPVQRQAVLQQSIRISVQWPRVPD